MNTADIMDALGAVAAEREIEVDVLLEALANGIESAYKRMPESAAEAYVVIDENFDIKVIAQEYDDDGNVTREWDDTPPDMSRIAAQTARQVMMQRIREVEREAKYQDYAGREGEIVTGIVQQSDQRYTLLDLGRVEALLPHSEQVPNERPDANSRLKIYIVEVRKTAKGPQIVVSRTHPGLIKELFMLEVPEIADGIVEIKACAREPGHRTKIAVWSNDHNVDPVGACVGARGARVRMVVNELRGEKIDIVPYSEDLVDFIAKALSPAKVFEVRIDETTGTAEVIVPDHQLSLAIGREGQNARLAARLTGWRVDIKSQTEAAAAEDYTSEEWAQGEWIENADTGELEWHSADGSGDMSAEEWSHIGEDEQVEAAAETNGAEAEGDKAEPIAETEVAETEVAETEVAETEVAETEVAETEGTETEGTETEGTETEVEAAVEPTAEAEVAAPAEVDSAEADETVEAAAEPEEP